MACFALWGRVWFSLSGFVAVGYDLVAPVVNKLLVTLVFLWYTISRSVSNSPNIAYGQPPK